MPETRKYAGGCHCGKVRYEVITDLGRVVSCNCSICSKRGHLLTFVAPEQFTLLAGEDSLADYQFNKQRIHHQFCTVCGVGSFGWGTSHSGEKRYSINVRCLDDVDLTTLELTHFDGKSL